MRTLLIIVLLGYFAISKEIQLQTKSVREDSCIICLLITNTLTDLLRKNYTTELEDFLKPLCYSSSIETEKKCVEILDNIIQLAAHFVQNGDELSPICYITRICSA
ncbi:uncharacterized protein LOC130896413 [Diorhabda carinulata]|uniref:uncharacterized protein LOC130896413 n=1 Tax=Diorhabda carinulata TaxID=1163345 RepID=UPI0025A22F56|nr:uncharacterized protein LOC130896413 [Diorhabda carinulata]